MLSTSHWAYYWEIQCYSDYLVFVEEVFKMFFLRAFRKFSFVKFHTKFFVSFFVIQWARHLFGLFLPLYVSECLCVCMFKIPIGLMDIALLGRLFCLFLHIFNLFFFLCVISTLQFCCISKKISFHAFLQVFFKNFFLWQIYF